MIKVYHDADGKGVGIDLTAVEAIVELDQGFVSLITPTESYRVKADFDCAVKAVEHEKDARCV